MAEAKKGRGIGGKLLITVILLMIGIALGMSSFGSDVKRIYYTLRFQGTPVAENFLPEPFHLKIHYTLNDQGQLETYLVNEPAGEILPIQKIEGMTQVGDTEHRMRGLSEETRNKVLEILEETKEGGSTALDKAKQLLEKFGK
jgi:hypothetical protein